jgi:hypothetical protein
MPMINKALSQLLDSRLRSPTNLCNLSTDRLDPMLRVWGSTPTLRHGSKTPSRAEHIQQRLGHISVNPSDPINRTAIAASYYFDTEKEGRDRAETPPPNSHTLNRSRLSTKEFIERIIQEAKAQASLALARDRSRSDEVNSAERLFLIHAPRGVGKTSFLNYALSRWSDLLDSHKVIWVRVDLVKHFLPSDNVERWIYAQLCKIVFRYYNSAAFRHTHYGEPYTKTIDIQSFGLEDFLLSYIRKQPSDFQNTLYDALARMRDVFSGNAPERPLSETLVNELLAQQTFECLLQNGYRTAVILDGFDRLEATPEAIRRFQELSRQISALADSAEAIGYPIVFVSRTSTQRYLSARTYKRVPPAQIYELSAPPLDSIMRRRLKYIKREVKALSKSKSWSIHDWPNHINEFEDFLGRTHSGRSYCNELSGFGQNRRAQLQILQLAYFDFLSDVDSQKRRRPVPQYRLIETMAKAGYAFPPRHYNYTFYGRRGEREICDPLSFDNRFLPNIFVYPYCREANEFDFSYTSFDILLGLRIAQLVWAREVGSRKSRDRQLLEGVEISQLLNWLFGYDQNMIKRLMVELVEFEVLYVHNEVSNIESNIFKARIGAMPKLRYILEEYLRDSSYLSLCMMRLPIGPFEPDLNKGGTDGLIEVARYDARGDDLSSWINAKCFNSISAYRIIAGLNASQEEEVGERRSKVPDRLRWRQLLREFETSEPFKVAGRIRSSLLSELSVILRTKVVVEGVSAIPWETEAFGAKMSEYSQRWG